MQVKPPNFTQQFSTKPIETHLKFARLQWNVSVKIKMGKILKKKTHLASMSYCYFHTKRIHPTDENLRSITRRYGIGREQNMNALYRIPRISHYLHTRTGCFDMWLSRENMTFSLAAAEVNK